MGAGGDSRAVTPVPQVRADARPPVAWVWSDAWPGLAYVAPAAIVGLSDPKGGAALAVGVLPAAVLGIPARRRARVAIAFVGVLAGVSMLAGSALATTPVLAVAAMVPFGIASAWLAGHTPAGALAMTLVMPLVGISFSFPDAGEGLEICLLIAGGSIYATLVALLWPERPAGPSRTPAPPPTLEYGARLGLAGATAAAIGFAADLEHVGWATGAALLVMRPTSDLQHLRSVGRVAAVALGAMAGVLLVRSDPSDPVYAAAIAIGIVGAAATRRSRWYVTPGFSTFLVFLLLLYASPQAAGSRFGERLGETALGVAIAYTYGLALPRLIQAVARRRR